MPRKARRSRTAASTAGFVLARYLPLPARRGSVDLFGWHSAAKAEARGWRKVGLPQLVPSEHAL